MLQISFITCEKLQLHKPGWRPPYGVEDAVVGPDPVAAEVECPIHGEEDVVVDDLGLVVEPRLLRVQADHVHYLGDAEAASTVGPDHLKNGKGKSHQQGKSVLKKLRKHDRRFVFVLYLIGLIVLGRRFGNHFNSIIIIRASGNVTQNPMLLNS